MSGCGPKLGAIVATYNGRIVMPKPLFERFHREQPDGAKVLADNTMERALRENPFVEVVTRRIEGCGNRKETIGYRAIRHYQHPLSHFYDGFATMVGWHVGVVAAIAGGTVLLAVKGAGVLLTGGFE